MKPDKQPTYSAQIIEIADILFAKPDKKMSEIVSCYVKKCRKDKRTVERYVQKAKEYNLSRLQKQEKAKDEVLTEQAKEAVKSAILSRNETLKVLSDIINDKDSKDADRINAIRQLSKMEGWDAAEKHEIVDTIRIKYKEYGKE